MVSLQPAKLKKSPAALLPLDTSARLSLKRKLQKQLHLLAYRTGISSLYSQVNARLTGESVASILMYHSIPAPHEVPWMDPRNCLSAEGFEAQMQFLANHRQVVSIDALVQQLNAGEAICPGTVAITFDDGYLNNLRVAAPILAKYNLPATLYLATAYVDSGANQWIDTLYGAFVARSRHRLFLPAVSSLGLYPADKAWNLETEIGRAHV